MQIPKIPNKAVKKAAILEHDFLIYSPIFFLFDTSKLSALVRGCFFACEVLVTGLVAM